VAFWNMLSLIYLERSYTMPEDSLVHNTATLKNVPTTTNENVPLSELGRSTCRRYIPKRKIQELAIEKYKTTHEGIAFGDITGVFPCSKIKAQRILKDCCNRARNGSRPLLFRSFKRTSPQQYFPSCIRADIMEDFKKRENVLKHPTEVTLCDGRFDDNDKYHHRHHTSLI
jgi:hypothetical protein